MPRSMSDSGVEPPNQVVAAIMVSRTNLEDEMVDHSISHDVLDVEDPNSTTATKEYEVNDNNESTFILFPKLPIEIRLKIWGLAAPEPCVLVQTNSCAILSKQKYNINRPVPSILHACQESRMEYLEQSSGEEGDQQHIRKRDHPVYKLLFSNNPTFCSPAFFSASIDTFMGPVALGVDMAAIRSGIVTYEKLFEAFTVPEISSTIQHLALRQVRYNEATFEFLAKSFPKLRTLTILVDLHKWKWATRNSKRYIEREPVKVNKEVNGELNLYDSNLEIYTATEVKKLQNRFADAQKKHPDWNLSKLKVRGLSQFVEVERIDKHLFRSTLSAFSVCIDH